MCAGTKQPYKSVRKGNKMIFSTITQNNLNLTADTTEIPAQYSNNIQFKFIQDNERFSGYIPTIYIGVYDSAMIECSDVINAGGAVVVDGDGVFAISNEIMYRNGFLAVGVTLTNNDENVSLKPVIYRIQASVGGLSPLPPDEGEWQQVVKAFVETLFNNWSTENLDPIKAQLEELISTAQTQQEKITSQQTQIDNAIGNMGDYEIVQEDPVQIRFKKGDGTFGETVDLGDGLASKAMVNAGYYTYKGISYGGPASNNGIDVAEIDGAYSQETTNGFQLFDASKLPTKSQGGATVTNNGDGSFTISGSGNLSGSFEQRYDYTHEDTLKLLKVGKLKLKKTNWINPVLEIGILNTSTGSWVSGKRMATTGGEQEFDITLDDLNNPNYVLMIRFRGNKDSEIKANIIKPMLYQEKNLFDYTKIPYKAVGDTSGGNSVTLFNNQDGSFTIAGKNLFNVNGNVNVKGNNGAQVNRNTVQDGVLTSLINSATDHAVGQRLYGLKGKTISFSAKLKSIGNGAAGGLYIYDGRILKKQAAMTALNIVFAINNYTCETDDVVVAFGTGGGTGAQFYDIMVNYGAASASYVAFDTPVTLTQGFVSDALNWDNNTLKQKLKAGTITLDALSKSLPYFEALLTQGGSGKLAVFNNASATMSRTINQEWLDASDTAFRFGFYNNPNQLSTPTVVYPIVYQPYDGTWEPFTGGEPSPSPSYPQEPKFIGDVGQNLFDASKLPTKSQGGATVTNNDDGSFTISGSGNLTESFSIEYQYSHEETLKMLKVGKITLNQNGDNTTPYVVVQLLKTGGTSAWFQLNKNIQSANITQEMLQDADCVLRVLIYGQSGSTIQKGTIRPMLYQDGDGTFEPFTGGVASPNPEYPQEPNFVGDYDEDTQKYDIDFVTSGKNLLNNEANTFSFKGVTFTINKDKSILLSGTATETIYWNDGKLSANLYNDKIYTLSGCPSGGGLNKYYMYLYNESFSLNDTGNGVTNMSKVTKKVVFGIAILSGVNVNGLVFKPQLEIGTTATDYQPYQGFETTTLQLNQPLRELPNGVKDTIENGVVTRRVGEITYDGSSDENWALGVSYGEKYVRFSTSAPNITTSQYKVGNVICDKFPYRPYEDSSVSPDSEYIIAGSGYMYVLIEKSRLSESTAQGFKTWLQSNPITVWYELATPTTEQITLPTLPSWYPYTDAWVGTELQPSFVEWHIKAAGVNQNDLTVIKEDISQLQTETTQLNDDVTRLMGAFTSVTDLTKQLFLLMHRVGDIIFSTSDENPSTIYGGTWVAWGKGQVPVGVDTSDSDFNTVEKTGGEKEHTLTVDEMPSHKHDFGQQFATTSNLSGAYGYYMIAGTQTDVIKNTGGNQPHNNLQPYITCYMWKRTA